MLPRAERLDRLPFTREHGRLVVGSGLGWALDAMDVGLISFVMAALAVQWDLSSTQLSWIGSIGFVGMALGASLGGLLADRFGRRQVFALTLLVFGIATGAAALSWSVGALIVFRFLIGVGLGAELPVASTLVSEFAPARLRGRMVVLLEAFWHTPQPILDPLGFLHLSLGRAHEEVARLGANLTLELRPRATCAICLVQNGSAFWAHIGDSRVYLLRRGKVFKRTRDHSHVEFLLREGVITADQALTHPMRNFVECCLGGEPFLPEMTLGMREPLEANDILLVCSDGLWGGIDEADLGSAFQTGRGPLREELLRLAEKSVATVGAGSDNTTAAVVRWIGNS